MRKGQGKEGEEASEKRAGEAASPLPPKPNHPVARLRALATAMTQAVRV